VEEQVVGGYKQAVAISEESDGQSGLVIKRDVQLQRPRSELPSLLHSMELTVRSISRICIGKH
jgi:hypothetical protein